MLEVSIVVEERNMMLDRNLRNQAIDAASNRNACPAALGVNAGRFDKCQDRMPWLENPLRHEVRTKAGEFCW